MKRIYFLPIAMTLLTMPLHASATALPCNVIERPLCKLPNPVPDPVPKEMAKRQELSCAVEHVAALFKESVPAKSEITVVTFNVNTGRKIFRQLDNLKEKIPNIDVLMLTEIDRGCTRSKSRNVAYEYAKELNMHYAYGVDFYDVKAACEQGTAILSKYPLSDVGLVRFAADGTQDVLKENRLGKHLYLKATIEIGKKKITLVATRLAEWAAEENARKAQAEELANFVRASKNPVILGGDFGFADFYKFQSIYPPYKSLTGAGLVDTNANLAMNNRRTYVLSVTMPGLRKTIETDYVLDFIFVKGLTVTNSGVGERAAFVTNKASDHAPVWAVVKLP